MITWLKKLFRSTPEPEVSIYNPPVVAKPKNLLHSLGDTHDYLKQLHGATMDTVWPTDGGRIVRLHLPDGSVIVGRGETVDLATGALIEKLGGL